MSVPDAQIAAVRRFNRFYTRKIGVLHEGLLHSPYSLTEVRVLYEIAHRDGIAASDLVADLDLDPGYLSRILARFEAKRLVTREPAAEDARRRRLRLTAAGRRAFAPLEARSQQEVAGMLTALEAPARERLLAAMQSVEQAFGTGTDAAITLRTHRPGDLGWVVQRHGELYFREYGWGTAFEAVVAEIAANFLEHFDPQRERCWIAERDGQRLGCIFLVAKSETVAQLRLLLIEPEARGLALGHRLVDECIAFARTAGYRKIVLWTQNNLGAARHIYAQHGFRKIAEEPNHSFAPDLMSETWELRL